MTPDQILSPDSKMDLPPPVQPQEAQATTEANPVLKQGSEVNPEFLPPVSTDQPQPPVAQDNTAPAQQPPVAAVDDSSPATQAPQAQQPATTNPILAEDVDLIEKEWVNKAKAIVEHTKDDPRRQNHEINKMKADYIKKRYNKDIQVGE